MIKSKKTAAALQSRIRPGTVTTTILQSQEPAEQIKVEGLELSDLYYKPLSFFKENPENVVFRSLKKEEYFAALEKDIREAGAILSPLIAMPDGLLIEGESRLNVAKKLTSEGLIGFERLPVRIVNSSLTTEEQKKRLFLGNLSRFEIDEETRLLLYAEIWPDFFKRPPLKAGRRPSKVKDENNSDTVSQIKNSNNSDTVSQLPTIEEIATATGKSTRQTKRDAATYRKATNLAKAKGKENPDIEDIREAKEKVNSERREKESNNDEKILVVEAINKLEKEASTARNLKNNDRADAFEEAVGIIKFIFEL